MHSLYTYSSCSIKIYYLTPHQKKHFLTKPVVPSVRFRTKNVRNRTLFLTPIFSFSLHNQPFNVLARFLLYNQYRNEQLFISLKHDNTLFESCRAQPVEVQDTVPHQHIGNGFRIRLLHHLQHWLSGMESRERKSGGRSKK